jgi:Cu+-exporting ATPase
VLFIAVDGRAAGAIAIADPVKATTPKALAALRADGIRIVMLTGDNRTTAQAVAKTLGSASPWVPAPMSPSRAPASPW